MSKTEVKAKNTDEKEVGDARVYELGYLLVPTISEENIGASYSALKDTIVSMGGVMIADEMPKMMPLAYQMVKVVSNVRTKHLNAYFGWFKFDMGPEAVIELKKKLDLDKDMIRFLLIKTVRENTIATKRFVGRDTIRRKPFTAKKEGESEVPVEINKEEIDKEIDALASV